MALEPGTRLGHYEVTALIGEGGMGQVHRARDTKLDRDVALKILPETFVDDPERLARFQREAKVLASLNHPNIAAIHGLEDSGETHALVLELVEGPTLQDRIAQGAIPLDEALPIAQQIAEALEAAHEQAIIHRDLKPANIKVTPDGVVKVLDFGLAKALEPEQSEADVANSPTMSMTAAATRAGFILGTAAYMSPEQAKGRPVDKRTDIWAFGVVLYEMLTGRQAFEASDISQTLAFVLTRDIEWDALPPESPPPIRRLLRRCLVRDRKRRLGDMSVAGLEIDEVTHPPDLPDPHDRPVQPDQHVAFWQRPVSVAAVATLAALVASFVVWTQAVPDQQPGSIVRFPILLPEGQQLTGGGGREVVLRPQGTHLVYDTADRLYLRAMDQMEAVPIRGTEGARNPFFSPDGEWIGFHSDGELKKVAIAGGAPVTLATVRVPQGPTWTADDTILFGQEGDILGVSGSGGDPEVLIATDPTVVRTVRQPQMLPDGRTVLFTARLTGGSSWGDAQIIAHSVETGEQTVVLEGGTDARYLDTGHLVYLQGGIVFAVPFDATRLEVTGGPVSLVDGVRWFGTTGTAMFDVSRTGSLVYLAGGTGAQWTLVWVDRDGNETSVHEEPAAYRHPRASFDGRRVTVGITGPEGSDIWIVDAERNTRSRLTVDGGNHPIWSPDGNTVAYRAREEGSQALRVKPADGGADAVTVLRDDRLAAATSWHPNGSVIAVEYLESGEHDVWIVPIDEGAGTPEPLLTSRFKEASPMFSPDGRWLAYISNETGRDEVYVQPYPGPGSRISISTSGGREPIWSADGTELFYRDGDQMMVVAVGTGDQFTAGRPQILFDRHYRLESGSGHPHYNVVNDGRFLMIHEPGVAAGQISVVLNWSEELKARVPSP